VLVALLVAGYLAAVRVSPGSSSAGRAADSVTSTTNDAGAPPTADVPPRTATAPDAAPGTQPPPATTATRASSAPAVTIPSAEDKAGRLLWSARMEDGTLAAWYAPETGPFGDFGGGAFDDGGGMTTASTEQPHTGAWSAKLALPMGTGGARLFRWRELRAERDTTQRVWLFIARTYRLTADATDGRFWDIMQFKSTTEDRQHNDPLWFLNVRSRRGELVPELVWWHKTLEGPHQNEWGNHGFLGEKARLPVGRWFELTSRIRQSSGFDGIVQIWIDQRKIFDFRDVRTSYHNCTYNAWCADTGWSVNNYSDGLAPAPAVIYADDAVIERNSG
jgi:hypothetical protein